MPGSANRECLYIRANTPSELCAWVRSCSRPTCLLRFDARSLLCLSLSLFPSVPAVLAATQYRDTRREKNCRKVGEAKREAAPECRKPVVATVGWRRWTREPREIDVRVENRNARSQRIRNGWEKRRNRRRVEPRPRCTRKTEDRGGGKRRRGVKRVGRRSEATRGNRSR